MIHVIAEIGLVDGMRDRFLAEFHRVAPLVRAEDGCIEYVSAMDTRTGIDRQARVRDDLVTVIEKWESEAALAAHLSAPHMDIHRANSRDLVATTAIHILAPA